jgi:hypothetical protein
MKKLAALIRFIAGLALLMPLTVFGFFGTIVTPFEVHVRVIDALDKPLQGCVVGLHHADAFSIADVDGYWPWRFIASSNKSGSLPAWRSSAMQAGTVFSGKRLRKLAFMMMLQSVGDNQGETKLMPLLIDIDVGRFGSPKVKIFDADISEFKSYQLVKPSRTVQLDGLSIKAIAEPSMIELQARQQSGWLIRLELRWPEAACQVD